MDKGDKAMQLHIFYAYDSSFYAELHGGHGWFYGLSTNPHDPVDDSTVNGPHATASEAYKVADHKYPDTVIPHWVRDYLHEYDVPVNIKHF